MQRPHDDYKLEIKVKKVSLNESISDDRFQLQQPSGTELVKVGESGPGKQ
jgi:outer membrane lipoprotein-sorting protein